MLKEELSLFISLMLIAGGPRAQLARVRWPLHQALREISESAARTGDKDALRLELAFRPSADAGIEVLGANSVILELIRNSTLVPCGQRRSARLVLNENVAVELRRELIKQPLRRVSLIQRAGMRWAALDSTAAKNLATAALSAGSTVASATAKRA